MIYNSAIPLKDTVAYNNSAIAEARIKIFADNLILKILYLSITSWFSEKQNALQEAMKKML